MFLSFVLHYFSKEEKTLSKTRKILHSCRKLGNKGTLSTMVLEEFYALTHKKAGRDVAERHFNELLKSGLSIVNMTPEIARQAAILRCRYQEKIPWGDCIIAATGIISKAKIVVTEDPHFEQLKEIKAETLAKVKM